MKLMEITLAILPLGFLWFAMQLWKSQNYWASLIMIFLSVFFGFCVFGIVYNNYKRPS